MSVYLGIWVGGNLVAFTSFWDISNNKNLQFIWILDKFLDIVSVFELRSK